jgi:hypothetical protein
MEVNNKMLKFMTIVWVLFAVAPGTADGDDFNRLLRDKLIENGSSISHGSIQFYVERKYAPELPPVKLKGTVSWRGDDAFWVFRISDPGKVVKPTFAWAADLPAARTEYMLKKGTQLILYNGSTNTLHVYLLDTKTKLSGYDLFDVFPKSNWHACYAPSHLRGRSWSMMIGPSGPALSNASTRRTERSGDHVVFIRNDLPQNHTFTVNLDLKMCGNVTSFVSDDQDSRTVLKGAYRWDKRGDDCILRDYDYIETQNGKTQSYYKLRIDHFDPGVPIDAMFSFEAMKGRLPKDVVGVNHVTKKMYHVNPLAGISETAFGDLADALRRGNIMDKK